MSDHSPSHLARVKVQFWVPAEGAGEVERWREMAQAQGLELGPWLRMVANLAWPQNAPKETR